MAVTEKIEAADATNDKKIEKVQALYKVNEDQISKVAAPLQLKFKYHFGETMVRLGVES